MDIKPSEIIDSATNFANALKDNQAAIYLIYLIVFIAFLLFAYFFVKMISKLIIDYKTESKTDKLLSKVDDNLTRNERALGMVVVALERIKK